MRHVAIYFAFSCIVSEPIRFGMMCFVLPLSLSKARILQPDLQDRYNRLIKALRAQGHSLLIWSRGLFQAHEVISVCTSAQMEMTRMYSSTWKQVVTETFITPLLIVMTSVRAVNPVNSNRKVWTLPQRMEYSLACALQENTSKSPLKWKIVKHWKKISPKKSGGYL